MHILTLLTLGPQTFESILYDMVLRWDGSWWRRFRGQLAGGQVGWQVQWAGILGNLGEVAAAVIFLDTLEVLVA